MKRKTQGQRGKDKHQMKLICVFCEKPMMGRPNKKYCSPECNYGMQKATGRTLLSKSRKCVDCGEPAMSSNHCERCPSCSKKRKAQKVKDFHAANPDYKRQYSKSYYAQNYKALTPYQNIARKGGKKKNEDEKK